MSTRFAGENETEKLLKQGYVSYPSELGQVFLPGTGLTTAETVMFGLTKLFWSNQITVKGLRVR